MNGRGRFGWAFALAAVLFSVAVAIIAYNIGVSDGAVTGGTAPVEAVRRVQWGWHGAGALWPLAFLLFWSVFWMGCSRRRRWYGPPYGFGYGPYRPPTVEDQMDDWHRRAHERMKGDASADDPGRRG